MFIGDLFNKKTIAEESPTLSRPQAVPVKQTPPPLNVPQGWEAKTQADGSTRISKQGSMSSADYKQNMADYKAKNWTPEKMADYGQRMASGQGYTDAERSANYQQQQKSFGQYADTPLDEQGMAEGIGRGEYSRVLTALGLYYPRLSMEELNVPGFHKVIANKADVPVEYAAQVINDFVKANEPDDDDDEQEEYKDVSEARNGDTNFGSTVGHGSWVVYDGGKVKRFKSRDGAKAYAAKNGGKVASSEFYADKIQGKQGVAEGLNEFAPSGGGGGRWYSDDQLYDIIGEDWLEAFDVSGDQGNIDLNGERARLFLAQEAEAWLTDRGYRVNVLDVKDDGDELSWYIQGALYRGLAEGSKSYLDSEPYTPPKDAQGKSYLDSKPYSPPKDAQGKSYLDPAPYNPPKDAQGKSYLDVDPMKSQMDPSGKSYFDTGVDEGFDDLDRFMKDKYGPKPSGGSGIKHGTYGQPGRQRGRKKGELSGAFHQGGGSDIPHNVDFDRSHSERSAGRRMPRFSDDYDSVKRSEVDEGSVQDKLYKKHQELRKKRGAPDPEYYQELKKTFDLPDDERQARTAELKKKYQVTNEDRERYLDEIRRAGYDIVTEAATLCPECGGAAYEDRMLAEKQDACYHKVKSRYKVWPSAYASGALVRCRKKGAANWGNKSKK